MTNRQLAELIREGSRVTEPSTSQNDYFVVGLYPDGSSYIRACAMGAAYYAANENTYTTDTSDVNQWMIDEGIFSIGGLVISKNDHEHLTREQVAMWLETQPEMPDEGGLVA